MLTTSSVLASGFPVDKASLLAALEQGQGSLASLKQSPSVLALCALFAQACSGAVRIGTSESTSGAMTLFLPGAFVPVKDDGAMRVMLNLAANQRELERKWAATTPKQPEHGLLLANHLLMLFERDSGVAIMARKTNSIGALQLTLAPCDPADVYSRFRYSPSYFLLRGLDADYKPSAQMRALERQELSRAMLVEFWRWVEEQEAYMLDDELRARVDGLLDEHFRAGICDQREGFIVEPLTTRRLGLFLLGAPGVGKSTWVRVFARALKSVLRAFVAPEADVCVVKVPLNAMTPQTLTNVLSIKGISDWSVERVMEQAVTKGHTVVLHLEENPEDVELQTRLFACVERMLNKLFHRYPEYRANVVFIFTANYEPAPVVAAFCEQVFIQPPGPATQARWCARQLSNALGAQVKVSPGASPTSKNDIRPLNAWWMTMAHCLRTMRRAGDAGPALVERRNDGATYVGWSAASMQRLGSEGPFFHFTETEGQATLAMVDALGARNATKAATVLRMGLAGTLTPAVLVLAGANSGHEGALDALARGLAEMAGDRPVTEMRVELLTVDDECKVLGHHSEIRGGLLRFIDDATNPRIKRPRGIYNRRDDDDHQGDDDAGNAGDRGPDVALVIARINAVGSLLLRELIEAGDKSRTHRLGVSKTGLVFLMSLVNESDMTPQLESRAHLVLRPA